MKNPYAELFERTTIGSIPVKNRYTMGPMGPLGFATADGGFNPRAMEFYTARARGGAAMIITGVCQVSNPADPLPTGFIPNPNQKPGVFRATGREMTERIHAFDTRIVIQVGAGFGRVIMPSMIGDRLPAAPSAVPYRWDPAITCREITKGEIAEIVGNFRRAAHVIKDAGFDGIQVHAVHEGYLLDQFAIELFNQRTDEYGGSLENRLRFAREVVEAIHEGAGDDFPVHLRFSPKSMIKDFGVGAMPGEEFVEKGRDMEEGIAAAKLLHSYGYEVLDVDVGSYDSWYWSHPPMYQEKGLYLPYARQLKDACPEIPLIVAGRMDDPELALSAVRDGTAQMISLARPLLADPEIVSKIRQGRLEQVRPCISCQEGCIGRIEEYSQLRCAVNPVSARETERPMLPVAAVNRKKVMIIGGGAAGLEAARVLKTRGHEPVVYERGDKLGGVIFAGGQPGFKEDDLALIAWYDNEMRRLGVEVHLNTEVTAELVGQTDPDEIIVATGSNPILLDLGEGTPVIPATDALLDEDALGKRVAIIGGGVTGCELGLSLRAKDVEVFIIEALDDVLLRNAPICMANHEMLHDLVGYKGIELLAGSRAKSVNDRGLVVDTPTGERQLEVDSVVTAIGYRPNQALWSEIADHPANKHRIGDARKCANIMYAIWDAYEVTFQM